MKLFLVRKWKTDRSFTGELFIGEDFQCFTLELPELYENKANVPQKTCCPTGIYEIELYPSPHFKRLVPLLKRVPGRSSIEIHIANEPEQLRGCIAVGQYRGRDYIGQSKAAFDPLFEKIQFAIASGELVTITITVAEAMPI
jgi:hypothetical protein